MIEGLQTHLVRKMADFPMKPSIAKVLIAAVDIGCSEGCSHRDQTRQGHSSQCGLSGTGKLALMREVRTSICDKLGLEPLMLGLGGLSGFVLIK
jgi:hypothetical protein